MKLKGKLYERKMSHMISKINIVHTLVGKKNFFPYITNYFFIYSLVVKRSINIGKKRYLFFFCSVKCWGKKDMFHGGVSYMMYLFVCAA
jgi:hypothetical protein